MPATAFEVKIRAGQSLSDPVLITASMTEPTAMITPSAWDDAIVTFQMSSDGIEFYDVCNPGSDMVMSYGIRPNRWVRLAEPFIRSPQTTLKIRSGHPDTPVVQKADRIFKLVQRT